MDWYRVSRTPGAFGLLCVGLLITGPTFALGAAAALGALGLFAFLPGLTVLAHAMVASPIQRLLSAFFLSLPLSTGLFGGSRILDLPPIPCAWAIAALYLAVALYRSRTAVVAATLSASDRAALLSATLAATVLWIALQPPGIRASWHGFFHTAVVEQILNESIPPSNPGLAAETLNFYWAFHVFVALLTAATGLNPLITMAAINTVMLPVALLLAYEAARPVARGAYRFLCMGALLGAINTGAGAVLLAKFWRHGQVPGDKFADGTWIDWISQRAIPGRIWDGRASSFIKEFYDLSGMASGMTLLFAYIWLWVVGPGRLGAWFAPLLIAVGVTLLVWYPPLAIPLLVHAPIALARLYRRDRLRWIGNRASAARIAVALLLGAFISLGYFRAMMSSAGWIAAGEPFLSFHLSPRHAVAAITPFWLLIPFAAVAVVSGWRNRNGAVRHLALFALLLFALAAVVDVQQRTQYKFVYGAAFSMALLAAHGLALAIDRIAFVRRHVRVAYAILTLILIHPALLFAIGAATSTQRSVTSVHIEGRSIVDRGDPARMTCLAWVRDNTPQRSVLLLPLVPTSPSPTNVGFRQPAIARRAAWLVDDTNHSRRFRAAQSRAAIVRAAFEDHDWPRAAAALQAVPFRESIYALTNQVVGDRAGWTTQFANGACSVLRWAGNGDGRLGPAEPG